MEILDPPTSPLLGYVDAVPSDPGKCVVLVLIAQKEMTADTFDAISNTSR